MCDLPTGLVLPFKYIRLPAHNGVVILIIKCYEFSIFQRGGVVVRRGIEVTRGNLDPAKDVNYYEIVESVE